MYFPEEYKKINKFIVVNLPKVKDLYQRVGSANIANLSYTGDDVAPSELSHIEQLSKVDNDNLAQLLAENREQVESESNV